MLQTEEEVIVRHILNLNAQGFTLRLAAVKDIANSLLAERRCEPVSRNWAATFIKRRPKL
jgi:hypothetical protein